MDKNKKIIWVAVVALIISVTSIGIAFAALSQDLTVKGSAIVDPISWNVKFDTVSLTKTATGGATGSTPSISTTAIESFLVTLTKPGDTVTYTFDVLNDGSLNAKIGSIIGNPNSLTAPFTCNGLSVTTGDADELTVCDKIKYTLKYTNDSINNLSTGDLRGQFVDEDDQLPKKVGATPTRVRMELKIEFDPLTEADEMPEDDVEIDIDDLVITYIEKIS